VFRLVVSHERVLVGGERIQLASGMNWFRCSIFVALFGFVTGGHGEESFELKRVEIVPLADHRVSMQIDGVEKIGWNFGSNYPRPFFYPFRGPSGAHLTRMGHPGAEDHDHHQSVWFAHHIVDGMSFWAHSSRSTIRQKHWYAYRDGNEEGVKASLLGWYDEEGNEVAVQDVVAALRPMVGGEYAVEIQMTFRPGEGRETVHFEKTNFGFFAVRVAKSISARFGGGDLTNSEGTRSEAEIFGKPARWMNYSGPVAEGAGKNRKTVVEGMTFFDHPDNPNYPNKWHVRGDGWMGASPCMDEGFVVTMDSPLTLRYLLHAHSGDYEWERSGEIANQFGSRKPFLIAKSRRPHQQYEVWRAGSKPVAEFAPPRLVESKLIWDKAPHNAFTDLLFHEGRWYCVFREGSEHVSPDGSIRVIVSDDGESWESQALVEHPVEDLRDAKLTVTPEGHLMLNGAGMQADKPVRYQSFSWFSEDKGKTWTKEIPIGDHGFWLWRAQWHKNQSYTMGYSTEREREERTVRFYRSDDGRAYETLIPEVNLPRGVGEDTILFLEDDTAICLFRCETGNKLGFLGTAKPPYDSWSWKETNKRIGGPNMIQLPDGRIIAAVRSYDGKAQTLLSWVDLEAGTLTDCLKLPSGGDTSYAGLVWKDDLLWVSYYSSHEGKTSIYLAKVAFDD